MGDRSGEGGDFILAIKNSMKVFEKLRKFVQKVDLDAAMLEALLNDRVEFVQLFLDNGVQLKTFVTFQSLSELYRRSLAEKSNTIVIILEQINNRIEV